MYIGPTYNQSKILGTIILIYTPKQIHTHQPKLRDFSFPVFTSFIYRSRLHPLRPPFPVNMSITLIFRFQVKVSAIGGFWDM